MSFPDTIHRSPIFNEQNHWWSPCKLMCLVVGDSGWEYNSYLYCRLKNTLSPHVVLSVLTLFSSFTTISRSKYFIQHTSSPGEKKSPLPTVSHILWAWARSIEAQRMTSRWSTILSSSLIPSIKRPGRYNKVVILSAFVQLEMLEKCSLIHRHGLELLQCTHVAS